jgi:16S rRNA (cytidine1402-2'-O)-methyltransferase
MPGELILVATPIGNLGDLSQRAEEVLREADAIACEDTRHTMKLLSAKGITGKRLLAVHEHNEHNAAAGIVALIERGERIALVTDAGTPGISDPGEVVVKAVIEAGWPVTGIPGPVAAILALTLSGLPADKFVFEGFLPIKAGNRRDRLAVLSADQRTFILYEAPHRMLDLLVDLVAVCGDERRLAVCRELTKRFEEIWRGTTGNALTAITEPKGEYVVVVAGAAAKAVVERDDESIRNAVNALRGDGLSLKDSASAVATSMGIPRKRAYDLGIAASAGPKPGGKITKL